MIFHAKKLLSVRRITILMLLLLVLQTGFFVGNEAVAASAYGLTEHPDSKTAEKKADFLLGRPKGFFGLRAGLFFRDRTVISSI